MTDLLRLTPVSMVTINTVFLPRGVYASALTVLGLTLLAGVLLAAAERKGSLAVASLRRGVTAAFAAAALAYAAFSDTVWLGWLKADTVAFLGLTSGQKVERMDPALAAFAARARAVIPGSYQLYPPREDGGGSYPVLRTEYLLLPLRKRRDAEHIVVVADAKAGYDRFRRRFTRGPVVLEGVDMALPFSADLYVLRKRP
ncbi:MAG: hypothetical protein HY924_03385 [Elusimicrobia bacterium]|nr:hypothetical protein [Elusimicrobiota bacterium]